MSWNKGFTKETHLSVMKISQSMKKKHLDNFKEWRDRMKEIGKIPKDYPKFKPSEDLAEFIGVILGDGNISRFPRTERLLLVGNANNPGFINHYAYISTKLFKKAPTIMKAKYANALRLSIYQKHISDRLVIPVGDRSKLQIKIPNWIWKSKHYIIKLLKGFFEAEGSLSIHLPTCTYNFQFKNTNTSLLATVKKGLILLGYHPEIRTNSIRLRKKAEVEKFKKIIQFRKYNCGVI